jgi:Ca-activated chloride channel homolog
MNGLTFSEPSLLAWAAVPIALMIVWMWRILRRAADARRLARRHTTPVPVRVARFGDAWFWCSLLVASALLVAAIARPVITTRFPKRAGIDVIVLQDASASMRVSDIARSVATDPGPAGGADAPPRDRWQRSMRFLRELGDALSWTDDRVAMIAFAHIATPQIRLTRDPNTLFFFLDHLYAKPPFRLEDDTTWDTNLEEAIGWGLRVLHKDQEIHGRSRNTPVFVMLSDGEAWSGEVAKAVAAVRQQEIALHVIGVGTLAGAPLPTVRTSSGELLDSPGVSRLDRASLQRIAAAATGRYFELDRDSDRHIANTIVADTRRRAPAVTVHETTEDQYWWFVATACVVAALGVLSLARRVELAILLVGSVVSAILVSPRLW